MQAVVLSLVLGCGWSFHVAPPPGATPTRREALVDPGLVVGGAVVAAILVAISSGNKGATIAEPVEPEPTGAPPPVVVIDEPKEVPVVVVDEPEEVQAVVVDEPRVPFVLTKAVWSGDAFRATSWPPSLRIPARVSVDPRGERASWSGSIFASPARAKAPPTAAELAAKARLELVAAVLPDIQRAPAPAMARAAWSGDPFAAPQRAALPQSRNVVWRVVGGVARFLRP